MYQGREAWNTSENALADIGKDWGALTSLHIWMWTSSIMSAFGIVHFLRFLTVVSPPTCVNTWLWRTHKCGLKTKRESNKCLSFWKNKLPNLRTWIRTCLFEKKYIKSPSSISALSAWCLISWQDWSSAALHKLWAVITAVGVNYSGCVTWFWWRLTKWVALWDAEDLTTRWITAD